MQKEQFFSEVLLNQKNSEIMRLLTDICDYLENKKNFSFNPVLINGKTETGKSHIMTVLQKTYPRNITAIQSGDLLFQTKEELKTRFNRLIRHAEQGGMPQQLLIIDDIQRLREDAFVQEQLLYCMEKLLKKQLILFLRNTDTDLPMPKIFETAVSQGLTFTLQEPDLDIKVQYTQKQADEQELKLGKEQCLYIARRSSGFRNIQNMLNHIRLYKEQMGAMPSLQDIKLIVSEKGRVFTLNPESIIATVAEHYGFTIKEIKGRKRYPRIAEARHLSIYLCRTLLGETYMEIGKIFGGKDHSTIVYSIKKIEEMRVTNKVMNNLVTEVTMKCQKSIKHAKQT